MPPMSQPLRLLQLSDTHLFADDQQQMLGCATVATLTQVLNRIQQQGLQPDLLLLTGDLSQDETPASYERLWQLVAPLAVPTYWIRGNHDQQDSLAPILSTPPLSSEKAFGLGNWRFVLLNSQVPHRVEGTLSEASLSWLEQQLQQYPDHPTLVALHHHPIPINSPWMDALRLSNPDALFEVLDHYAQVKLVVFGHIHQAFQTVRRGVTYLGCPSTCLQFQPNQATLVLDPIGPGFRLIDLDQGGHHTTQVQYID